MLSKIESIMTLTEPSGLPGFVSFKSAYDDTKKVEKLVLMADSTWVDMGQPTEITATFEPGDTLNKAAVDA